VISGWNITNLKVPKAFRAILATIWLYTLFVGASATVIGAAVMGTIVVVRQRAERPAHAWTTYSSPDSSWRCRT
jgi:competence protein ComEC